MMPLVTTSGPAHPAPNLTIQVGNIIPLARNIPVGRANNAIRTLLIVDLLTQTCDIML